MTAFNFGSDTDHIRYAVSASGFYRLLTTAVFDEIWCRDTLIRFDEIHERDLHTDGRTDSTRRAYAKHRAAKTLCRNDVVC